MDATLAAIASVASGPAFLPPPPAAAPADASAPGAFARLLQHEVGALDDTLQSAEAGMRDLAADKPVELHDVMIGLERARISVQTFVQVRNKLVEAFQDLMRMQL